MGFVVGQASKLGRRHCRRLYRARRKRKRKGRVAAAAAAAAAVRGQLSMELELNFEIYRVNNRALIYDF